MAVVETFKDNIEVYSKCQPQNAKMEWQLYVKVGHPYICKYKSMTWSNFLRIVPVNIGYLEQADKIYLYWPNTTAL